MVYILVENPKVTHWRQPARFARSNRRNQSDSALLYKVSSLLRKINDHSGNGRFLPRDNGTSKGV